MIIIMIGWGSDITLFSKMCHQNVMILDDTINFTDSITPYDDVSPHDNFDITVLK
jgi:hypothetical protein